jgi:ABC-type polysaccharide/polyol phosphate export permease
MRSFPRILKESLQCWEIIWALTIKDMKLRYTQRYLRMIWIFISPLFSAGILTLVFSRIGRFSSEGIPYPVFTLVAFIFWSFFAASISGSCYCLLNNSGLIKNLKFPRMTIPLSTMVANGIDLSISCILLFIVMQVYHLKVGNNILYLIPVFIIQLILMVGLMAILSIATAYVRDIRNGLPVIMSAWMLISPVGYSFDIIRPSHRVFYLFNPMTGLLDSYRKIILHNRPPDIGILLPSIIISCLFFLLGMAVFSAFGKRVADVI